jgi:hypothetical protein
VFGILGLIKAKHSPDPRAVRVWSILALVFGFLGLLGVCALFGGGFFGEILYDTITY